MGVSVGTTGRGKFSSGGGPHPETPHASPHHTGVSSATSYHRLLTVSDESRLRSVAAWSGPCFRSTVAMHSSALASSAFSPPVVPFETEQTDADDGENDAHGLGED